MRESHTVDADSNRQKRNFIRRSMLITTVSTESEEDEGVLMVVDMIGFERF